MQLSFLGKSYAASVPAIEATETQETATFMGQSYARRQYQVEQVQPLPEELYFMGQRYVRANAAQPQPQPGQPRPGEQRVNSRQLLQIRRSRATGRRHPAFRGS